MIETFLFGDTNSRKKYMKKSVVIWEINNGKLSMDFLYYEKSKRWTFITKDKDKNPCTDERFLKLKKLWENYDGKEITEEYIRK